MPCKLCKISEQSAQQLWGHSTKIHGIPLTWRELRGGGDCLFRNGSSVKHQRKMAKSAERLRLFLCDIGKQERSDCIFIDNLLCTGLTLNMVGKNVINDKKKIRKEIRPACPKGVWNGENLREAFTPFFPTHFIETLIAASYTCWWDEFMMEQHVHNY